MVLCQGVPPACGPVALPMDVSVVTCVVGSALDVCGVVRAAAWLVCGGVEHRAA